MASWKEDFKANNNVQTNTPIILNWFEKADNKALNPARLLGLDSYSKPLFKYIIQGLIEKPDEELTSIIDKLKTYYNNLDEEQKNSELVFFDLLIQMYKLAPTVVFKQSLDDSFISKIPDFRDHVGEQLLNKLDFYDYVGVKSITNPVEPMEFIENLIKDTLTTKELDELNRLLDLYEEDNLNIINKFKYKTRRCILLVKIVRTMLRHLDNNDKKYYGQENGFITLKTKLDAITEFIVDLKNNYYTLLNYQEQVPPAELFMGFYAYMLNKENKLQLTVYDNSAENWDMELHTQIINIIDTLAKYFHTIEKILIHSEVSEIKTQECVYDLYDLIQYDDDGKIYPLRTIRFRRDFALVKSTITIEGHEINTALWREIDKLYCWPKKIPLSLFLGILSEVDSLEVFYNIMKFELGNEEFFKTRPDVKVIENKVNDIAKCAEKIEPEPINMPKSELTQSFSYTTRWLNSLGLFATNLYDAYAFYSLKDSKNANLIRVLILDAGTFYDTFKDTYMEEVKEKKLGPLITSRPLKDTGKFLTKEEIKSFLYIESGLLRIRNKSEPNVFTNENIFDKNLSEILSRFETLWSTFDFNQYGTSYNASRPDSMIADLTNRFTFL